MTRILYIGDPIGVHDPKWITWFSLTPNYEAHLVTYPQEFSKITADDKARFFNDFNIHLHQPIDYYSLLQPHKTLRTALYLRRLIKEYKIDIVHALFATPSALWGLHVNVPYVVTTRGSDVLRVIPDLLTRDGWHGPADRWLYKVFGKAFNNASAITSTSHGQIAKLWELYGIHRVQLIRTGVDVEAISKAELNCRPAEIPNGPFIFLPRYTEPIYNTELQANALAMLADKYKNSFHVVMVGGNAPDYERGVAKTISDAGWKLTVVRNLSQPAMWATFRSAKLSIMTPLSDGTPNSALEAMAACCPNILGAFTYDEDLFGPDFCLRMKTWEHSELANLIDDALSNDQSELVARAFANISLRGNRAVEMEKLRGIYDRLMGV